MSKSNATTIPLGDFVNLPEEGQDVAFIPNGTDKYLFGTYEGRYFRINGKNPQLYRPDEVSEWAERPWPKRMQRVMFLPAESMQVEAGFYDDENLQFVTAETAFEKYSVLTWVDMVELYNSATEPGEPRSKFPHEV